MLLLTFSDATCWKQDLCYAALAFASDNLKDNGHFVCKYYQGAEDKQLYSKLEKMFTLVHREKPDSSRKVCISDMSCASSPSFASFAQQQNTLPPSPPRFSGILGPLAQGRSGVALRCSISDVSPLCALQDSKEAYFVALRRKGRVTLAEIEGS